MSFNPFIPSLHGNPNFNPVKVGKKVPDESKVTKLENKVIRSTSKSLLMSNSRYPRKGLQSAQNDGKVSIQSVEEDKGKEKEKDKDKDKDEGEDENDEVSLKDLAFARFKQNHKLINEIFSDTVVPDLRSVVTTGKMTTLKNHVQVLINHHKRLQAEIQSIEDKHEAKKMKFLNL
ncbi:SWI/SNF-related matrix-associated actin-dependent regulator of chromatin subfamily E member 1-like [Panonychus citri]|uniref:SWI/SNF-related matrix-associated actin-dependent regulator of chromatin subfamily E member 1-like n=1 Tax=Panonychus citri TaxID=50023 RepID=UPI002307C41F|nr:SWI/SNF-related matrix-associated actin-dependent regulator of chromatin subfamily E member 1-like [Panonychus citri]